MGWYFSDADERLRYEDGRKIAVGTTHTVDCEPVLCEVGLHASKTVLQALAHAPGSILWRVRLGGKIVRGDDKSCATERKYLKRLDATDTLRAFSRKCALDVVHLWDAPRVVIEYLRTGEETKRDAAQDAAWDAAQAAVWAFAQTQDAARAAAWAAAKDAAKAARAAALAAQDALAAAQDAAWDAARAAARAAQTRLLDHMVRKAIMAAASEGDR